MEWKHITINSNMIALDTIYDKSILIYCPKKSKYGGYSFWHPSKCVNFKSDWLEYPVKIAYTDDWKFKLIKYEKRSSRKIGEVIINAALFEEIFGVVNQNSKIAEVDDFNCTHIPADTNMKPVENNLREDLIDE